nr:aquaporin [Methanobrevibacter smithii]
MGIPLTGISLNPAHSLTPALVMSEQALSQVLIFIIEQQSVQSSLD